MISPSSFFFFFFNDTATTEIYTLSLHDALPILLASPRLGTQRFRARHALGAGGRVACHLGGGGGVRHSCHPPRWHADRKSTRLNSSHVRISYAVFCLEKKKKPYYSYESVRSTRL